MVPRSATPLSDRLGSTLLAKVARPLRRLGSDQRLPPAELGTELRAIIDALGLKCEPSGWDVIVYGAATNDALATRSGKNPGWVEVKCRAWREVNKDRWEMFEKR